MNLETSQRPTRRIHRRTVLRGLGVSVALPLLESLLPRVAFGAAAPVNAQRMAVVTVPFGMVVDRFHPQQAGLDYPLSQTLEPLKSLRQDFTVFSNLDHDVRGGHAANHTLLSGVELKRQKSIRKIESRYMKVRFRRS